jgi:hypothetical protein
LEHYKEKIYNIYETIASLIEVLFILLFVIPVLVPYGILKEKVKEVKNEKIR